MVHNGVRLPSRAGREDREPGLIALLGRIDRIKGHDVLVEALPAVVAECPGARAALVGAAVLPSERRYLAALLARVGQLSLSGRVELCGEAEGPAPILGRASVVVAPSRSEGLPNAVLEAMAHGTPVVAADVGGVRDLIEHGVTGLLVPPDDPEQLASAVVEVLRRPGEAFERATRARQAAERGFSPEAMVQAWERVYESSPARLERARRPVPPADPGSLTRRGPQRR
jgi:glycosyltransferase involved in cell wall biosynthesis